MIQIDEAARSLDGTALRLYVRLLGMGVAMRTRTLDISDRWLYTEMKIAPQTLTEAKRQIARFVGVDVSKGVITKYALPLPWLQPQQPLIFSTAASVSRTECPGIQDTGASETRTERPGIQDRVQQFPGHSASETRTECPGIQDTVHQIPGHSVLENRTPAGDGQDLPIAHARADGEGQSIDRSKDLSVVVVIDRIVCAEAVESHQRGDARELAANLNAYMQQWGPSDRDTRPPDEQILARCFAVAPLGELTSLLSQMRNANTKPGASYAWFVATFAHRLRNIKPAILRGAMSGAYRRKHQQNRSDEQQLLDMVQAGVRRMA